MRRRRVALSFVVALLLLWVLLTGVGWGEVWAELRAADRPLFAVAVAAALVSVATRVAALARLVTSIGGHHQFWRFVHIYLAASFARRVMPWGSAGGSAILAYLLARDGDGDFEGYLAAAVALDVIGFSLSIAVAVVGLAALSTVGVALPGSSVGAALVTSAVVVAVVLGLLAVSEDRLVGGVLRVVALLSVTVGRLSWRVRRRLSREAVEARLRRFFGAVDNVADDRRGVLAATGLRTASWLLELVVLWLCLVAVGAPVSFSLVAVVTPIAGLGRALPSPGGLGGVEIALAGLLVGAGVDVEPAAAGVLLYRVATYWLPLVLGGVASLSLPSARVAT